MLIKMKTPAKIKVHRYFAFKKHLGVTFQRPYSGRWNMNIITIITIGHYTDHNKTHHIGEKAVQVILQREGKENKIKNKHLIFADNIIVSNNFNLLNIYI